jgi:hypothetical protein
MSDTTPMMLPGSECYLRIGSISHHVKITRTVLHELGRLTYSALIMGTDLALHGIEAHHFSPAA